MKQAYKLLFGLALATLAGKTHAATNIVIDGKLDPQEWQSAQVFEDYVQSYPNTGERPKFPTTTYLISDEKGIYIAFKNFQPERSRKYSGHDQFTSADFNMVFIDFNNDGDTAYELVATLGGGTMDGTYSRGNQSNRDWDGEWQVQVSEQGDYWYSEFFIPWTTTSYKALDGDMRTVGVYFQRQNVIDVHAYSFPDTHRGRKNFTYEFHPVTVKNIKDQSFNSSAYVTANADLINDDEGAKVGVDLTWKPTSNQQVIATIRPDFGQVESDELIVNYSAVETLRTDKRPFFTVNQSLFDVQGPSSLKLVNTRRIGANAVGSPDQLHDIDVAAKYVYNDSRINAGMLLAKESDVIGNDGKDFASLRWYSALDQLSVGQLFNYVADPINDRTSMVLNHDVSYRLDDTLNLAANLIYSHNEDAQGEQSGSGVTLKTSYAPMRHWQNNLELMYLDDELDINDFGYMRRNNIATVTANTRYDDYQFASTSPIRSTRLYGEYLYKRNTQGLRLRDNFFFNYGVRLRSNHTFQTGFGRTSAGQDDLITRQIGSIQMPTHNDYYLYYRAPSPAPFTFNIRADRYQEGESGWARKLAFNTTTYFTDTIRLNANYTYVDSDDWLIGNSSGQVSRFQRRLNKVYAKLIARLDHQSDITLTTQWFGLKARGIDPISALYNRGEDFNVSQFALQARYRKRFENGSTFYLVYSHNGVDQGLKEVEGEGAVLDHDISFQQLAMNAFDTPTQKSITAKLNWVF